MSATEKLVGGVGDGAEDQWFAPKALRKGMAEEREHTKDPAIKKEIAKDHLTQDPRYYDKLEKMEKPAHMNYTHLLKQAMPIPQGASWNPGTNSLSLAKPIGVKQTPGSLQLKPGESVGAPAAAPPSVTPAPVAPPPMPVTNAPPPPITDTPITSGFASTPPPKSAAAAPVTAATPPPLPMPPPAQPMPVPAAAPVAPRVPVSPPQQPQAQHPTPSIRSASMKNATILERSALLMCVTKAANSEASHAALAGLGGAVGVPAVTGLVRALMNTEDDRKTERGRLARFGRGALYGAVIPLGAAAGMGVGSGVGGTLGGMAGGALGNGKIESVAGPAGVGMMAGGAAGGAGGGYTAYRLIKKLLEE